MKFLSTILLCMMLTLASAQNISVTDFRLDEMDLTANQQGTTVLDQNGDKCALIKVVTTETGFSFDNGALGIVKTIQKPSEVWVYVPNGTRRLTISHPQMGQLRDYAIPVSINKAKTYVMQLSTGRVHTIIEEAITQQYVLFTVEPKNAIVELDGSLLDVNDGTASKRLPFGTYSYKVQAPRHYPEVGKITVSDPNNKHLVNVKLKPAYASITFKTDPQSEIWINGEKKGIGQYTGEMGYEAVLLESRRANHRSTKKEMTIDASMAGMTITIDSPQPIHGSIDFDSTPADAKIIVDGKKVGTTPMLLQRLLIGEHEVKISRNGYKDYVAKVKIEEGKTTTVSAMLEKGFRSEGNVFTVNGVSFTMIPVEGGTFTMGATQEMKQAYKEEKPAHQVTLSSYYIGETEVTQTLWHTVMGNNPSKFKGGQNPVEQVSWNDCQTFISKLNQLTGKKFRLPTEAEWEFAARGGNKSLHTQYSGSSNIDEVAWYGGNSGNETHPLKTKKVNELGIYDMSGNVWEWCQDWYGVYDMATQTNPTGPTSGYYRVYRGGGWFYDPRGYRLSRRNFDTPDFRVNDLGFRLALSDINN